MLGMSGPPGQWAVITGAQAVREHVRVTRPTGPLDTPCPKRPNTCVVGASHVSVSGLRKPRAAASNVAPYNPIGQD